MEIDGQVIAGADPTQLCTGGNSIAVADIHLADGAADVRHGVLGLQCLGIIGLGLCFRGGDIGGIDGVEKLVLLHDIALLKCVAKDLAGYQRGNSIGIGGLQRTAASEGIGDAPLFHAGGGVGSLRLGGLGAGAAQKRGASADDRYRQHAQYDPPSAFLSRKQLLQLALRLL